MGLARLHVATREARALASKFHKQFPNSMLLPMTDEAARSIP